MFARVHTSWCLIREAWAVLRQDRGLLLFPFLSGIFSLLALASFALPMWFTGAFSGAFGEQGGSLGPLGYFLVFLFYLVTYFIVVFFNSALVACVRIRFAGGEPTVQDGLSFAMANVGIIFQWALLSATVGMLLRAIEERAGWLGRLVIGFVGIAWTLATMFVVPVLVHERVGPFTALKHSAATFRRTWGEAVVGNFGMSLAFLLLYIPGILMMVLGAVVSGSLAVATPVAAAALMGILIVLFVVYALALSIVQSALQGIFLTACYQYATTGVVPSAFTPEHIVHAWRPK
jgi:hypothetical protein